MGFRLTEDAEEDVIRILVEGGQMFGLKSAEHYYHRLMEAFDLIAAYPMAARRVTDTQPAVHLKPFETHVILYIVDEEGPLIFAIRHAREDWTRLV